MLEGVKIYCDLKFCCVLLRLACSNFEQVKVPIIVAGCKLDLREDNNQVSLEQVMSPIMQQFREIETCIECSALKQLQVT